MSLDQNLGDKQNPRRRLGFGAPPIARGMDPDSAPVRRFIGRVAQDLRNPSYYLPVVESVTVHFGGPLTPQQVGQIFGTLIDPFTMMPGSPPAGALSVDSTFVEPGKTQTWNLICGISWTVEPDPVVFTAKGNAFTKPTVGIRMPVSPDFYTLNDILQVSGGFNSLGMIAGQQIAPAFLDWAKWTELAMYYMVRAYNLEWKMGSNHFLINQSLRNIAYLPTNAQDGSASASEEDVQVYARRVNDYYENNLGSLFTFLPIDRVRVGSFTNTNNIGVFRPSRAYETVGATYGGVGLRNFLRGNGEIVKLSTPYLMAPGVPIGLRARVSNSDDQKLMQNYLDATQGQGGLAPAIIVPEVNIQGGVNTYATNDATTSIAGTAGFTGVELTLDASPTGVTQQVPTARAYYKGGAWKIRLAIRGWELDEATKNALGDPNIQDAMQRECGCAFQFSS
jgi:hypothetical protein